MNKNHTLSYINLSFNFFFFAQILQFLQNKERAPLFPSLQISTIYKLLNCLKTISAYHVLLTFYGSSNGVPPILNKTFSKT